LAVTLWLSTYSAERSYELGNAREKNRALAQQKEALERDVLEAQAAPALAEAAQELGMIPSRDTAHLVQDPAGNWVVVGEPKPAAGAPPPPLNAPLPDPVPPPPPADRREVMVRVPSPAERAQASTSSPGAPNPEAVVRTPLTGTVHQPSGALPGPVPPVPQEAPHYQNPVTAIPAPQEAPHYQHPATAIPAPPT
jgi:hypothetical protein